MASSPSSSSARSLVRATKRLRISSLPSSSPSSAATRPFSITQKRHARNRPNVQASSTNGQKLPEAIEQELAQLRLPRAVQATYMSPLKRTPTHNVKVCDLQLRSYSVRNLEVFADFALRAAYFLRLPASGPRPLPRIVERWTVPRSNFVHKKSQENFERITLRRQVQIKDGHPETVALWLGFLQKYRYYGVGMKANTWDFSDMDVGREMTQQADEISQGLIEMRGMGVRQRKSQGYSLEEIVHTQPFKGRWGSLGPMGGAKGVPTGASRILGHVVDSREGFHTAVARAKPAAQAEAPNPSEESSDSVRAEAADLSEESLESVKARLLKLEEDPAAWTDSVKLPASPQESLDSAKAMLTELISKPEGYPAASESAPKAFFGSSPASSEAEALRFLQFDVPAITIGSLVGAKRRTIAAIRESSGANIKLQAKTKTRKDFTGLRKIQITGDQAAIKRALSGIREHIDSPVKDGEQAVDFAIPHAMAGSIIGEKGSIMTEMRQSSGTTILMRGAGRTPLRSISIFGEQAAIKKALSLIRERIQVMPPRAKNGNAEES